jgi:hypothetical protein
MEPSRNPLQVILLMSGLVAQNVGIGPNAPTHLGMIFEFLLDDKCTSAISHHLGLMRMTTHLTDLEIAGM